MPAKSAVMTATVDVCQLERLLAFENPATKKGECVPEKDDPCGNGILDKNEECDVGKSVVKNQDKCCNRTCHLRESAQCRGQCINGRCVTKDCKELGDKNNRRYRACMCDNVIDACKHCCQEDLGNENLRRMFDNRNASWLSRTLLQSGQCINGTCVTKDCKELGNKIIGCTEPACVITTDACKHCCQEDLGNENYGECLPTETRLGFRERCYKGVCNEQGKCVPEKDVPCGNGVLDTEEECDAGEESLKNQDKCCNRTCHLKESAQCRGQCINGRCITTYCKELGEKDNRRYRACMCDHDVSRIVFLGQLMQHSFCLLPASVACKRCCLEVFDNDTNGPCFPTTETLRPGQRCYNGECDEKGECIPSEGLFTVRLFNFFNNLDFDTLGTGQIFFFENSVVLHKVIAMENRKLQVEENNLHKQLFHYETLKKSDISLHVRHHRDVDTGHVTARTYVTFFTLGMNFSMVLKAGSPVVAPGLRAYTVDRNGKYEPLHVDSNDFLTGHLQAVVETPPFIKWVGSD
ncbi:hypothetical protein C0Q70_00625 [Pomacea canaliculata]|uniref:Disintegrin domain-containing protein n=1 Tax=Pomacea canaliculata TaxID=400727 RepID=A0A2T7PX97_POMCA|nr:hypothetical protein C0Q70_00625 [Pomacea canaliculata]